MKRSPEGTPPEDKKVQKLQQKDAEEHAEGDALENGLTLSTSEPVCGFEQGWERCWDRNNLSVGPVMSFKSKVAI